MSNKIFKTIKKLFKQPDNNSDKVNQAASGRFTASELLAAVGLDKYENSEHSPSITRTEALGWLTQIWTRIESNPNHGIVSATLWARVILKLNQLNRSTIISVVKALSKENWFCEPNAVLSQFNKVGELSDSLTENIRADFRDFLRSLITDVDSPTGNKLMGKEKISQQLERCRGLLKRGDIDEAAHQLMALLKQRTNEDLESRLALSTAYRTLGAIYFVTGNNISMAIEYYNKAIQLNPNFIVAYCERAIVAWCMFDDVQMSLDDFEQAIKLKGEHFLPYYWRGVIYQENEDLEKAILDFKEALSVLKSNSSYFIGLEKIPVDLEWTESFNPLEIEIIFDRNPYKRKPFSKLLSLEYLKFSQFEALLHIQLGKCYQQINDVENARLHLQSAYRLKEEKEPFEQWAHNQSIEKKETLEEWVQKYLKK